MQKLVWLVPAALLVLALAPLPYGFYTMLRLVVCAASAYLAWRELEEFDLSLWVWGLGGIAVLFNPLIPIHLNRDVWVFIDVGVAVILVLHMWSFIKRTPLGENDQSG